MYRGFESHPLRQFTTELATQIVADFSPEPAVGLGDRSRFDQTKQPLLVRDRDALGHWRKVLGHEPVAINRHVCGRQLRSLGWKGRRESGAPASTVVKAQMVNACLGPPTKS